MRIISIMLITFILSGCLYHQPVEQGNVLTPQKMSRIKNGMSEGTVLAVLGQPVMENVYKDNRLVYVYTLQPSRTTLEKTSFIVTFSRGRVVSTKTLKP